MQTAFDKLRQGDPLSDGELVSLISWHCKAANALKEIDYYAIAKKAIMLDLVTLETMQERRAEAIMRARMESV